MLGEAQILETKSIRSGDLGACHADGRGLEIVKAVFHGKGENLGRDTKHREAGFDGHEVTGLLEGLHDGLNVERLDGAEVDDFSLNPILALQFLGDGERLADAAGEGDDGQVFSGALNLGLANGKDEVVLLGSLTHRERLSV